MGTVTTAPGEPIPVALCFDVEPDEFQVGLEGRPWTGFERMVDRIGPLRDQLAAGTGRPAQFNWFVRMDPQITGSHGSSDWVVQRYGDRLEALRSAGDTIGLHPHGWRWDPGKQLWIADNGDADWLDHCVRVSFETYETTMGQVCRAVRMGDRFLSPRVVRLIAGLGGRYDLTAEP